MTSDTINEAIEVNEHEVDQSKQEPRLERGRLYQFNGKELVPVEPSDVMKVPVTTEAMDALKGVRKRVADITKGRPELMIVASAMLITAGNVPGIEMLVKDYGRDFYR